MTLIQDIILSPTFIFIIITVMLLYVSRWALFIEKEYPGYFLGWLMSIFFIIIYQSITGKPEPETTETVEQVTENLPFFQVMLFSLMGLGTGFGITYYINTLIRTRPRQSASVAITVFTLVLLLFFLTDTSTATARYIGIFALGFATGALSKVVFFGNRANTSPRPSERIRAQNVEPDVPPSADIDKSQRRFDEIRRRFK
ncbi:MAG: hypothetical protein Kow00117_00580 [Phototrophicales bacterium]